MPPVMSPIAIAWIESLSFCWGLALVVATLLVRYTHGAFAQAMQRFARRDRPSGLWVVLAAVIAARWGLASSHPAWVQAMTFAVFLAMLTPTLLHWLIAPLASPRVHPEGSPK